MLGVVAGVAHSLLVMNGLGGTDFAILISLMWSLLPGDLTNQNSFIFTAADVVPCSDRKTSPRTPS